MANATLKSQDIISAAQAECYVTIDGNRYNLANMINSEWKFEKTKVEVPILGKTGKGNKATGWKGTFTGEMHYNMSILRELAERYKDTGEDTYFDAVISNEDKTSDVGRQTAVFNNCNLDSMILAKFDADADTLTESIEGTFDDFSFPEKFKTLDIFMASL